MKCIKAAIALALTSLLALASHAASAPDAYQFVCADKYTNALAGGSAIDNLPSGWTLDNRGGAPRFSIAAPAKFLRDISTASGTALIRPFNPIHGGKIDAEVNVSCDGDGGMLEWYAEDGKTAFRLKLIDACWCVQTSDGGFEPISDAFDLASAPSFAFRLAIDLDDASVHMILNGEDCGYADLLAGTLAEFRFATDAEHTLTLTPGRVNMTANFAVYEDFDTFGADSVYGWSRQGSVTKNTAGELAFAGASSASKPFAALDDRFVASCYVLLPYNSDFAITLADGANDALVIASEDGSLVSGGESLYDLTPNLWYRLRIEGDLTAGIARIKLNGRYVGEVPLTASTVDGVTFTLSSGSARIDELQVFADPEHADYCPAPETRASLDDYVVMVNVCSLWRNNGGHYGWACISPFDDNKPVLGYYDEGNPECADWEIKYMVDHGIDVQAFCWYNDASSGSPKKPRLSEQLHDGYMNAKYSDYMKYILILELSSGTKFNMTQWKNYVVPYLFENYFLDDRYLKLDNKIVVHIYNSYLLGTANYFGDYTKAAEALDYLDDTAKTYGFDGIISLTNDNGVSKDGKAVYSWGVNGCFASYNISQNLAEQQKAANDGYYFIPTVSVGYNRLPWANIRSGMISVDEYREVNEWVRDTYIPSFARKDDWTKNIVMLSTWNEYGEGTYISPAGLNGFGYLNVIRDVYTDLSHDHTDVYPTAAQLERINRMYPQNYRVLARLRLNEDITKEGNIGELDDFLTVTPTKDNTTLYNLTDADYSDGISATTTAYQPIIRVSLDNTPLIDEVSYIRIRLKAPAGSYTRVFFSTNLEPGESETKVFNFSVTSSEMTEYMIPTAGMTTWKGKLRSLRIDTAYGDVGARVTVGSIDLLRDHDMSEEPRLFVNGIEVKNAIRCAVVNGRLLHPYDPQTGVGELLRVYTKWDKENGVLTLSSSSHSVSFTVGSDKYYRDGVRLPLGYTVYLSDGLPMLDFETVASSLGYTYERVRKAVRVDTPEKYLYDALTSRKEGAWEFNDYDTEGWTCSNSDISVRHEDGVGYLHFDVTSTTDPMMMLYDLDLDASRYGGFEIRYRLTSSVTSSFQLFFRGNGMTSFDEKNTAVYAHKGAVKGEWRTVSVLFDNAGATSFGRVVNPNWKGKVTALRFDPFSTNGTMDIDYIRLIPRTPPSAPGINLLTGTTEPYTFEDDELPPSVLANSYTSEIAENPFPDDAVNASSKMFRIPVEGSGWPALWHTLSEPIEDAARPVYVRFDYLKTYDSLNGETPKINSVLWILKNNSQFVAYQQNIFSIKNGWATYKGYPRFDNAHDANDSSVISGADDPIRVIRLQGQAAGVGTTNFCFDNISFIPSYRIRYHINDGTGDAETSYVLFDSNGELLTHITLDLTKKRTRNGYRFLGWAFEKDAIEPLGGKSIHVPLENEDIDLYALWEREDEFAFDASLCYDFETPDTCVFTGNGVTYANGMMRYLPRRLYPVSVKLPADRVGSDMRFLVLDLQNNSTAASLTVVYTTTASSKNTTLTLPVTPNSAQFMQYVLDLGEFEGTLKTLSIRTNSNETGNMRFEQIVFADTQPKSQTTLSHCFDLTAAGMRRTYNNPSTPNGVQVSYTDGRLKIDVSAVGNVYTTSLAADSFSVDAYPYLVFKARTADISGITSVRVYSADASGSYSEGRAVSAQTRTDGEYTYFYADWKSFFGDASANEYHRSFMYTPLGTGSVSFEEIRLGDSICDDTAIEKIALYASSDSITSVSGSVTLTPYLRYRSGKEVLDGFSLVTDSACAVLTVGADGSISLTARQNGTVTVTAYRKGNESIMAETTVTVRNQPENLPTRKIKWISYGNSIHKHGVAESIGWTHDWGMAASSEDKDYVHVLWRLLEEKYGEGNVEHVCGEGAGHFETDFVTFDEGYDFTEYLAELRAFMLREKPDIVTIQYGENGGDCTAAKYVSAMRQFIDAICAANPDCTVLLTKTYRHWGGVQKTEGVQLLADELDLPVADLGKFSDDKYAAIGLFEHSGVAAHPGDLGMAAIAKEMYDVLNPYLTRDLDPTLYTASSLECEPTENGVHIKASVDLRNIADGALAVIAGFDADDRLVFTRNTELDGGEIGTVDTTVEAENVKTVRLFVLDNTEAMRPLADMVEETL